MYVVIPNTRKQRGDDACGWGRKVVTGGAIGLRICRARTNTTRSSAIHHNLLVWPEGSFCSRGSDSHERECGLVVWPSGGVHT
jgi:hypothetical protein